MEAIKFIVDFEGKKTGLLIDFKFIEQAKAHGEDMGELLDDIEDAVALELSKFDGESRPYEEVRKELFGETGSED